MASSPKIAGFLVVLFPPEIAGKLPLYYGNNVVGRTSAKASLVLAEPSISQKHANIIVTTIKTTLIDIGSKNGTKINGVDNLIEKNQSVDVDESMIIHFADVKCQLELLEP